MKNAIEIHNLVKKYDSKFQLGSLDLQIPSGMIVGLIGENGAGKTTLIKSILDIIKIDSGEISIFGEKNNSAVKEDIGVVLDNMFFPELLTVYDIHLIMKDVFKSWDSALFFRYLDEFKLPRNKQLKSLSKGMRKKVEIVTALSHHPKLLILDEPTSGLDPVVRNEVLDLFLDFVQDEEHTIVLSTHITSDLEHIADHVVFLHQGNVVLDQGRDDIMDHYGILKCDEQEFQSLDSSDIVRYKKNKYGYEVLVSERNRKQYQTMIIDKITLEELMVLMIKGEKGC